MRKDVQKLSQLERDDLIRAFNAIQSLPPEDENSFFYIASYHGAPFRGPGYSNRNWWGGYCAHGNIVFPTWHRAYLHRLGSALQKQVPRVTLPYWNELDSDTTQGAGIPPVLLGETYIYADGTSIKNPLRSYTCQIKIADRLKSNPDTDYTKPLGYPTERFPFTSLYGQGDIVASQTHNERFKKLGTKITDKYLSDNVKSWLGVPSLTLLTDGERRVDVGLKDQYQRCLTVPNYTVFSNATSSSRWNDEHARDVGVVPAVSLETPHNGIHVAIGGVQVPKMGRAGSDIPDSRGDMGENEMASFDPIFYFHHCFVDLLFWKWQTLHGQTKKLNIGP